MGTAVTFLESVPQRGLQGGDWINPGPLAKSRSNYILCRDLQCPYQAKVDTCLLPKDKVS